MIEVSFDSLTGEWVLCRREGGIAMVFGAFQTERQALWCRLLYETKRLSP